MTRAWTTLLAFAVFAGASGACVDLFHSTDFATLCDVDASACGDGGVEAGVESPSVCAAAVFTQARSVCARLGACLGGTGSTRYGECLAQATLAYDCTANPHLRPRGATARGWSCLASATTCAEVTACVFPSGVQTCKPAAGGVYAACGNGINASTLVACGDSDTPVAVEPCVLSGRTCSTVDAVTNRGACTGASGARCNAGAKATCEGTSAVACERIGSAPAFDVGIDCATLGAGRCLDGAEGPACVPGDTASACTSERPLACQGDVVTGCVDGRTLTLDCKALGLACVPPPTARGAWETGAFCQRKPDAGGACDPLTPDTCSGTRLVSCLRGGEVTLDCASVGLDPCKAGAGATSACTPVDGSRRGP